MTLWMAGLFAGGLFLALPAFAAEQDKAAEAYGNMEVLLDKAERTVTGQELVYPQGRAAQVTSFVITLGPGETVPEHMHVVPLYGYILEGELTITYESEKPRKFEQGDALIEAMNTWHHGENTGTGPTRILGVFFGAEGLPNVTRPPE